MGCWALSLLPSSAWPALAAAAAELRKKTFNSLQKKLDAGTFFLLCVSGSGAGTLTVSSSQLYCIANCSWRELTSLV
jgi:hypothetical protein